ncbi:amidase [Terriglobus sp. 2YAB30_2]|uniref:amidase n=2 Tax=unclassified Terriglobus TaxID=2628988 RepID=UPI003F9A3340
MHFVKAALLCTLLSVPVVAATPTPAAMDRDLLEVSVTKLHTLYRTHTYTVRQVTEWYLARIEKYNPTYKPILELDREGALKRADQEDAEARPPAALAAKLKAQPLWGVPIVIKANTSIEGRVTSDGWTGFLQPGHELIAPRDAQIVAHFKSAGAVILGHTNMPDFAASDTNNSSAGGRTGNAYNVRYSPGGSSGGTATAVAANLALLGQGTDTSNSIRNPASTDSLVGFLPTRGLVSIAGIAPLDWLMDDTGPLARNVTDAAIALEVMAGEDKLDERTAGSAAKETPHFTQYLKADALKGKRFGVPSFILNNQGTALSSTGATRSLALRPETQAAFLKAIEGLRAAGATIVEDDTILPASFETLLRAISTGPYRAEGFEDFLRDFGPTEYKSPAAFEQATGQKLPGFLLGQGRSNAPATSQRRLEDDPKAKEIFWDPQAKALAAYDETLERLHLDGMVYPALQMPPNDEIAPQPDGKPSTGPHSNTGWVNRIGVPAVVVPGGFYDNGLPFGLEISGKAWQDGALLGYAYAYEQKTHHRKPPVLAME